MGNKHTSRKWKRIGCLLYALNDQNFNRFSARFDSTGQPGEADAEECEANAALAEAAPELLEALEGLLEGVPVITVPCEEGCRLCAVQIAARAAIKKARGEG